MLNNFSVLLVILIQVCSFVYKPQRNVSFFENISGISTNAVCNSDMSFSVNLKQTHIAAEPIGNLKENIGSYLCAPSFLHFFNVYTEKSNQEGKLTDVKTIKNDFFHSKNQDENKLNTKLLVIETWTVILSIFFMSFVILFLFLINMKNKTLETIKLQITGYEEVMKEKKEVTQKVDYEKVNELVMLAKNNDPLFLMNFKELYPQFVMTIKGINPNVRDSELYFCALTYLDFSTKDIAKYTYVTIRSVETRKNRLRKKYKIPSDKQLSTWMRDLRCDC